MFIHHLVAKASPIAPMPSTLALSKKPPRHLELRAGQWPKQTVGLGAGAKGARG